MKHPNQRAVSKLGIYKGIHDYTLFLGIHVLCNTGKCVKLLLAFLQIFDTYSSKRSLLSIVIPNIFSWLLFLISYLSTFTEMLGLAQLVIRWNLSGLTF